MDDLKKIYLAMNTLGDMSQCSIKETEYFNMKSWKFAISVAHHLA